MYFPGEGEPPFPQQAAAWRDQLVMLYDPHCNLADVDVKNRHHLKFGIGILFGGNTVRRNRRGHMHDPAFWSDQPD